MIRCESSPDTSQTERTTMARHRRSWRWAALAAFCVLAGVAPGARAEGKKLALLIGVDKYPEGSGFASLPYTERDVEELAGVLLASGYRPEHVRVLTLKRGSENTRFLPTLRNARREFALLAGDRKPEDSLLVALSGHGITRKVKVRDAAGNEQTKSSAFFCPIDADIADPESLLSLDDLYAALGRSEARVKVMLVDACRNEPTEGRSAAIAFHTEPPPPSVAALFACSDGEVAWDAGDLGGGHGVFFHYVIEGLKGAADAESGNRDDKVTLAELTAYTQDKVPDYVSFRRGKRQMPVLLGTAGRVTLLDLSGGRAGDTITSRASGIKLRLIPAGEFWMGSSEEDDRNAGDNETPRHRVRITRPFYLGMTEVTVGQFRRVVESSGYRTEAERDGKGGWGWNEAKKRFRTDPRYTWRDPGFPQSDDHPVTNVSWNDAIAFCNALSEREGLKPYYRAGAGETSGGDGYRLPTEAEWEYACRAGTTTRYQGGDDPETLAAVGNTPDATLRAKFPDWASAISGRDGYVYTAPVGRFRANAFGLYDMHGNVWEWCWDGYKADYYKESPVDDPQGHTGATVRVHRGGSWVDIQQFARSAARSMGGPGYRHSSLGFRVARVRSGP
jgi:formylglycine-generating enzyme required for sulfatase activity